MLCRFNPTYYLLDLDTSQSHIEENEQQENFLEEEDKIDKLNNGETPRVQREQVIPEDEVGTGRPRINSRVIEANTENPFVSKRTSK
jgi:hypothetical protein